MEANKLDFDLDSNHQPILPLVCLYFDLVITQQTALLCAHSNIIVTSCRQCSPRRASPVVVTTTTAAARQTERLSNLIIGQQQRRPAIAVISASSATNSHK